MIRRGVLWVLCLASPVALGSYRVYKLKLTYFSPDGTVAKEREEDSTLDAVQYEHYAGGYRNVRAEMLDTWYCPGDTSRRKLCVKQVPPTRPNRGPASNDAKRGDLPYNLQPVIP